MQGHQLFNYPIPIGIPQQILELGTQISFFKVRQIENNMLWIDQLLSSPDKFNPNKSAQEPDRAHIWTDTLIPPEISIMLERLFCPGQIGESCFEEDKTQSWAARRLFLPRFKGFSAMTPGKNML